MCCAIADRKIEVKVQFNQQPVHAKLAHVAERRSVVQVGAWAFTAFSQSGDC